MHPLTRFLFRRKVKKQFKSLRGDYRLHAHLLTEAQRAECDADFARLKKLIRAGEPEAVTAALDDLRETLDALLPPKRHGWLAENFDMIVSALAVAFCFRAYYYQPFKIPTGSMQPTLYGIHGESAAEPTAFDRQPLRFFKWCVTGEIWEDITIRRGGVVRGWRTDVMPGYASLVVSDRAGTWFDRYDVPDDIGRELARHFTVGASVRAGQSVWKGYVRSGDFLFVNRWIWNFRHPRLGETIVFSTQDIQGLPPGQHYIKRLCGTPGMTVDILPDSHALHVNGQPVYDPPRMREIAEHGRPYPGSAPYPGYKAAHSAPGYAVSTHFPLKAGEYLALGDNSDNSLDSRYWGTVPARNLLGPASFVHWPFASPRWGNID